VRTDVRFIEELTLNAWPCLQTVHYDGWLLRFARGYTRRANSVNPLYASTLDTIEKIRYCEQLYHSKDLPAVFKMTPAIQPADLDGLLAEQGYREEALTSVQTVDLSRVEPPAMQSVAITSRLTDFWLATYCRLNGIDSRHVLTMTRMLNNIIPVRCFAALRNDDHPDKEIIAVGLGVVERGYIGFFDIVTAEHMRNRGIGTQLMLHLLQWGCANGAEHAYLQVMCNNAPALRLYGKLGFTELYQYWYRVKPVQTS
jgi:N-acetylglutamate synthase